MSDIKFFSDKINIEFFYKYIKYKVGENMNLDELKAKFTEIFNNCSKCSFGNGPQYDSTDCGLFFAF